MQKYFDQRFPLEVHEAAVNALNTIAQPTGLSVSIRWLSNEVVYRLSEARTDPEFQIAPWLKAAIEGRFFVMLHNLQNMPSIHTEEQAQQRHEEIRAIAPQIESAIRNNEFLLALNWRGKE